MSLDKKIIRKYPHVDYVREMCLVKDLKQSIQELKEKLKPVDSKYTYSDNKLISYKKVVKAINEVFGKGLI